MRVAIITLPLHTNYGGILQAYALKTVLESQGHCVSVIDLLPSAFTGNSRVVKRRFMVLIGNAPSFMSVVR